MQKKAVLRLSDGTQFEGYAFGHTGVASGEIYFDTTMIGYTEVLTDPVYKGKLLTLTYPIIGNYGMPKMDLWESETIQPAGIIVHDYTEKYSHWNAVESLSDTMKREKVVGIYGIDTHILAQKIASTPNLTGQIVPVNSSENAIEIVKAGQPKEPKYIDQKAEKTILMIDLGANKTFVQTFVDSGINIIKVSGTEDFSMLDFDGIVISNGYGEAADYPEVLNLIKASMEKDIPVYGCGIGYDLMAEAVGIHNTPILPAHRSLGQPVIQNGTNSCFITRMSHGSAIDTNSLPSNWRAYFTHLNSKCNAGFIHENGRYVATTFQPDNGETRFIIDHFISNL
ncbi:carbamoyl phosphate synthase small subunit [Porphyromonadaceae bacterium W3.11]|nr:carbamoyl phosphate synthase small subunit [Porphyromonadaceae bacterium W3.11]